MSHNISVERCTFCGMCMKSCPMGLFEPKNDKMSFISDADKLCMLCGHCIAACPTNAIEISSLPRSMFPEFSQKMATYDELQSLLITRRSIRRFTDRPVENDKIEKIIAAVATAPAGMGAGPPPITVISGREKLDPMIPPIMEFYRKFQHGMKGSISKIFMRIMMDKDLYDGMKKFMPIIDRMLEYYDATHNDTITWGAPLFLIFHGPRASVSIDHDCVISCTYAMIAAQSLGLGTTMIGMVPPYIEKTPSERMKLGIPDDHKIVLSLIAGYSNVKYARGLLRNPKVNWI